MYNCCVKVNSTTTLRRRRYGGLMVGVMDPYWGSLHCVCTLTWYWSRNRGDKGAAEVTSIGAISIFSTVVPNIIKPFKTSHKRP